MISDDDIKYEIICDIGAIYHGSNYVIINI